MTRVDSCLNLIDRHSLLIIARTNYVCVLEILFDNYSPCFEINILSRKTLNHNCAYCMYNVMYNDSYDVNYGERVKCFNGQGWRENQCLNKNTICIPFISL